MSKSRSFIAGIIGAAMLAPGAFAEETALSGTELERLLPGSVMSGLTSKGDKWQARFLSNGEYILEIPTKNWSDKGTWEVKNDQYCSERGKRGYECKTIYHVEGDDYIQEDPRGQERRIQIVK